MNSGWVVWLTGLPASGKSTLARRTRRLLDEAGRSCILLDGDSVRAELVPTPGYGPKEREHFYASLAGLAGLLAKQGFVVLVPATAHRRRYRDAARAKSPNFLEVFVDLPLALCARRDTKGLYALAKAGGARHLPAKGYERPEAPDVVARGGRDNRAAQAIVDQVSTRAKKRRRPSHPERRHGLRSATQLLYMCAR